MRVYLIVIACVLFSCREQKAPLEKSIGLEAIFEKSRTSLHFSEVSLVYSKNHVEYDLYEYICKKSIDMYAGDKDVKGVEMDGKKMLDIDMIDERYKKERKRAFNIDFPDQSSSVWIIEYRSYVVVYLVDRY